MSSISIQMLKRAKGTYIALIEGYIEPFTRKKSTRTVKSYGYLHELEAQDPEFMKNLETLRDHLRKHPEAVEQLRSETPRRNYPSSLSMSVTRATYAPPLLWYGGAVVRRVWEDLELDQWFARLAGALNSKVDLDRAMFQMTLSSLLPRRERRQLCSIVPPSLYDFEYRLTPKGLREALLLIVPRLTTLTRYINRRMDSFLRRDTSLLFFEVIPLRREGADPDEPQYAASLMLDRDFTPIYCSIMPQDDLSTGEFVKEIKNIRMRYNTSCVLMLDGIGIRAASGVSRTSGCAWISEESMRMAKEHLGITHAQFSDLWRMMSGRGDAPAPGIGGETSGWLEYEVGLTDMRNMKDCLVRNDLEFGGEPFQPADRTQFLGNVAVNVLALLLQRLILARLRTEHGPCISERDLRLLLSVPCVTPLMHDEDGRLHHFVKSGWVDSLPCSADGTMSMQADIMLRCLGIQPLGTLLQPPDLRRYLRVDLPFRNWQEQN